MRAPNENVFSPTLEDGYAAVAVSPQEAHSAVRVCVVVRKTADPASGHFVLVGRFPGGRILLGCLCDSALRPVEWIELWLQDFSDLEKTTGAMTQTNATRDQEWELLADSLENLDPEAYITLPAAQEAASPTFIDLRSLSPRYLEMDGGRLEVCRDDALLTAAGLPSYSLSNHRYGVVRNRGSDAGFVTLCGAPDDEGKSVPLVNCLPSGAKDLIALNAEGGRMLARRFAPLGLMEFCEILAGRPWRGLLNARRPCRLGGVYRGLEDAGRMRGAGLHFFSNRSGQSGRIVETLHLKLLMIEQCVRLVRADVERRQMPLLNLSAESFRVRLGATGFNLPFCWTARVVLARPGAAMALDVASTRTRYFQSREPAAAGIYRPEELAVPKKGNCGFRITRLLPPIDEGTVVEGTFVTQERIALNEMIEVQVPIPGGSVTLFGMIDPTLKPAKGEAGFRSIPLHLNADQVAVLTEVKGVSYSRVPFTVLLPLNSPCDLFALGVLGLEVLFAGSEISLPVALDRCFSLAQQLSERADRDIPLDASIRDLFAEDPRWLEILGPQHLYHAAETMGAEREIGEFLPPELWSEVVATLIRFFPGRGFFSHCQDLNDAPALALHAAFDSALRDLEALNLRTRSLHVIDWAQNLEIARVIASFGEQASGL